MTKFFATLTGAGLLLALNGTTNALPAQPPTTILFLGSGHAAVAGGGHYDVARKSHRKTRHTARSYRAARAHRVHGSLSTGRLRSSMSGGRRTAAPTMGTSNVTTSTTTTTPSGAGMAGGANTGHNSINTPASRRRRVTPPGLITNNGQAVPRNGAGPTNGTP